MCLISDDLDEAALVTFQTVLLCPHICVYLGGKDLCYMCNSMLYVSARESFIFAT